MCGSLHPYLFSIFFYGLVNHIALFHFKSYCLEDYIFIIFYSLIFVFPSLPLCFFVQLFIHLLDLFSSYRPFSLSLSLSPWKNSTFHIALFLFNFYPHFFIFFHLIPAQNPPYHPRYFPQLFKFLLFLIFLLLFISSSHSPLSLSLSFPPYVFLPFIFYPSISLTTSLFHLFHLPLRPLHHHHHYPLFSSSSPSSSSWLWRDLTCNSWTSTGPVLPVRYARLIIWFSC